MPDGSESAGRAGAPASLVRHVMLIRSDDRQRVDAILAGVPAMVPDVPYLLLVELGRGTGSLTRGYSRALVMTFSDLAGLPTWDSDPPHAPVRDAQLACSDMIVVDYDVPAGP